MKRVQTVFLFLGLLMATMPLFAQSVSPPIRAYKVGDKLFTRDGSGGTPTTNPYVSTSVDATNTLIQLTIGRLVRYYSPDRFLDANGSPWGVTVIDAVTSFQTAANPGLVVSGGGSGGVTDASLITSGTLSESRLPGTVVKTTSTYSNPTWLSALDPARVSWTSSMTTVSTTEKAAWNAKQGPITITTTGSSGAATLIGNTLNIPQYSGGSGGLSAPQVAQQIADSLAQARYNTPLSTDFYLDGSGNLRINPAVLAGTLDPTPTSGSTNPVTSGGTYSALQALLTNTPLAGSPTAPTAAPGTNSTRVATTAYVDNAVAAVSGGTIADFSVTNAKLAADAKVGSLATLNTNNKASVTAAINENVARMNLLNQSPTSDFLLFPNLIMETEPTISSTSTLTVVAGSYYMRRFVATQSGTLTRVGVRVNTAGAGLTADPALNGIALYDNAGNRLAIADGTTAWASSGDKILTFDVPVNLVAGTTYQMAIAGNGTTQPVFAAVPGANMSTFNQSANYNWYRVQVAGGMATTVSGTVVAGTSVNRPVILGFSN